jgi:S4 domain protein YaaA
METIKIKDNVEYITLGQLLKIEGIISTGGEAKDYLAEAKVKVDGELENRRGRKLYRGMSVELENKIINLE